MTRSKRERELDDTKPKPTSPNPKEPKQGRNEQTKTIDKKKEKETMKSQQAGKITPEIADIIANSGPPATPKEVESTKATDNEAGGGVEESKHVETDEEIEEKPPNPNDLAKNKLSDEEEDIPMEDPAENLEEKFEQVKATKWCFDSENGYKQSTNKWHKLPNALRTKVQAFEEKDVFSEDGNSVHDMTRKGKAMKSPYATHLGVNGWEELLQELMERKSTLAKSTQGQLMLLFGMRLAKTDPELLFNKGTWTGTKLNARNDTNAWAAAYNMFGAPWKKKKAQFNAKDIAIKENKTPTPPTKKTHNDTPAATGTAEQAKKTPTLPPGTKMSTGPTSVTFNTKNGIFISKALKDVKSKNTNSMLQQKRKYNTFMKLRLPKMKRDYNDADEELGENFSELMDIITAADPHAIILPWNENSRIKALSKTSDRPTTRASIEDYVDRCYVSKGMSPWCRLRIGHNVEVVSWTDEDFGRNLRTKDMSLYPDKLQVKKTGCAGWWLGSHPATMNSADMEQAISQHPKMRGIPIEIRTQPIRLTAQGKIPNEEQVKACHLHTEFDAVAKCRRAMNEIYGSRTTTGFPLGKKMRFVPNVADSRFPCTMQTRSNVKAMLAKQKRFLKKTKTSTNWSIRGLDYMVEEIGFTLRQALMGIRSASDNDRNLFISVDEYSNSTNVAFVFHEELEEEAHSVIPLLSVIMEAKYGPRIWNWFTDDAKDQTAGFYWDHEENRVRSSEEAITNEILEDWEDGSDMEDDIEIVDDPAAKNLDIKFVIDEPGGKNQYGDSGSVKTFRNDCATGNRKDRDKDDEDDDDDDDNNGSEAEHTVSKSNQDRASSPEEMDVSIINDDKTMSTSTISESTENLADRFEMLMQNDPTFKAHILKLAREQEAKESNSKGNASPNDGVGVHE